MKTLSLLFVLSLWSHLLFSQSESGFLFSEKGRTVFPIMKFGFNYIKRSTGEIGLLFGMNGRMPMNTARPFSLLVHGPSLGFEAGRANHEWIIAPKISYEFYSYFTGCRFTLADYRYLSTDAFYFTGEAGITVVSILNFWGGINIPVHGENPYIPKGRFSFSINLPLLIFRKRNTHTFNTFEN